MESEQNLGDIIGKINKDTLKQICHKCIDNLLGRKGPIFHDYKEELNYEEFECVTTVLCKIFLGKPNNIDIIDIDQENLSVIQTCMEIRADEIYRLRSIDAANVTGPVLKNFDWSINWVLGSSSLASLQQPLLTLDLQLANSDKTEEQHSIELDINEVSKLISTLEQARDSTCS